MLKRIVLPAVVFSIGMTLAFAAHQAVRRSEQTALQASFERLAERTFSDAIQRLHQPMFGLGGFRGATAVAGDQLPSIEHAARYVAARDLPREFPGVVGFGVIQSIPRSEIAAFESAVHAEGDPAFHVKTSGNRPTLYVIKTIAPYENNKDAIGFDVGSEPMRLAAVERTYREGKPSVTAPIKLLQDPARRPGSLLLVPVFASGHPSRTGPEDRVLGIVYAAMVYDDVMSGALDAEHGWMRLAIVDLGGPGQVTVFDSRPGADAAGSMAISRDIDYFGRRFRLTATPTPAFLATAKHKEASTVLLIGLLASLLAALVVRQQGLLRHRAEALADAMTRDLDRLAGVARLTRNSVVITDVEGRIEWTNPAFSQLTGYTEQEVIGRKPGDFLQTEETDQQEVARLGEALAQRIPYSGVLLNRSKDGRHYFIEIDIQPVFDAKGIHTGFISIQRDTTERLLQSARLKASEELLDRTGELSRVGGWRLDVATGAVTWTRMTRVIHEVDEHYVPSVEQGLAFYAPEARPVISAAVEKGIADGTGWDLELPFITAKGNHLWVRAYGRPVFEAGKLVALDGAIADVTESVRIRDEIDSARQRLELILQSTGAGTWEWNVQTGEVRFNEGWARILGYSLEELQPVSLQTWVLNAHQDDIERSERLLEAHFRGETPYYECEVRMRHKAGHVIWVLDRGRVMTRTEDGQPEWMFGTHIDITERKQIQLRLQESEALLSTTLRSIGDAVLTTDAEGRITWINPVAEMLTGWKSDDARGRTASEVLHLEIEGQPGPAPCPVQTCLREGRKVGLASNTVLIARDGGRHVIEDSAAPLREVDGRVLGAVMVFRDVTEKHQLTKEMSFRATHDALTGLVNRMEFEKQLGMALDRIKAGGKSGILMFLDLDHFKMVNDACGHAAGDRLLVQIASIFRNEVRSGDVVGRFGGDEFAILLNECPLEHGRRISQKIVEAIDRYRFVTEDGKRFRVGVSIGLVPVHNQWSSIPQLLQSVDAACYAAKAEGRNRVVVDDGQLGGAPANRTLRWGPLIEQALDENLFELHAQRVMPLAGGASSEVRCEVLLRLKTADKILQAPGTFMPAAERYQLASRIDRWVLRSVIDALKNQPLAVAARVAINLSGQSAGDRAFHRYALDTIQASGLPPERFCIEITETAVVANLADAARFIDDLHGLGIQVALDDFGAGSASFAYLKSLKVDVLKIDGQFVRGLLEGALEDVAIRSFINAARVLKLRTVAEHVESEAVAARLTQLGVDFGQGYFFHRPEPLDNLLAAWSASGPNIIPPSSTGRRRHTS